MHIDPRDIDIEEMIKDLDKVLKKNWQHNVKKHKFICIDNVNKEKSKK